MIKVSNRIILIGILIMLGIIAFKPYKIKVEESNSLIPNFNISTEQNIINVKENVIGVVDTGVRTGYKGQLLLFEYDEEKNTFIYLGVFNYHDYINHPEYYNIPTR
ncbi:MAG: hypothetical protein PHV32_06520 [Eubacteriales bacterium]|nr:hypothetical protein [Eubacteriales bacterium]